MYYYKWSVPTNTTNIEILESGIASVAWSKTRKILARALENHVGSVDQHGSLTTLSPPSPHALYPAFKDFERIFAYGSTHPQPVSVVLDDSTIVSPIPDTVIESGIFLSLATVISQWWQQEQGLRSEPLKGLTHIRVMYVS
jgi:hypothetical protein